MWRAERFYLFSFSFSLFFQDKVFAERLLVYASGNLMSYYVYWLLVSLDGSSLDCFLIEISSEPFSDFSGEKKIYAEVPEKSDFALHLIRFL